MASKPTTVDFLLEQIVKAGQVAARKMFGEYGIYCDAKMVTLVCDDQLYIKPTAAGRSYIGDVTEAAPYEGAKPYFLIPGEKWHDSTWLTQLVRITTTDLPPPKSAKAK